LPLGHIFFSSNLSRGIKFEILALTNFIKHLVCPEAGIGRWLDWAEAVAAWSMTAVESNFSSVAAARWTVVVADLRCSCMEVPYPLGDSQRVAGTSTARK
jgi:hypothetical protein